MTAALMLEKEETLMFTVSENSSSAWEEKVAIQQMVWRVPAVAAWDNAAQCSQCFIRMRTG